MDLFESKGPSPDEMTLEEEIIHLACCRALKIDHFLRVVRAEN